MGVDYYNCTGCKEIFTTCGDHRQCCKCDDIFCNYCDTIEKVAVEDCEECDDSNCEEDCECEALPQWMIDTKEKCEQGCKEYHNVCLECQKPPPEPWEINDYELLGILAKQAGYKTVEEARNVEEEKRKEQMPKTKKRKREEEEEEPKKKICR